MFSAGLDDARAARTGAPRRSGEVMLRALLCVVFVVAGGMKLAAVPFEVNGFRHFGYPMWFMYAIGVLEVGAGALLLWRRFATPAAVLLVVTMVGAIWSHLSANDGVFAAAPAFVLLMVLSVVAWARSADVGPA